MDIALSRLLFPTSSIPVISSRSFNRETFSTENEQDF